MSEATPETTPAEPAAQPSGEPAADPKAEEPKASETDLAAEVARLKEELTKARKWETRSKENAAKLQQYEREKLPEAERAAAEAEERGRTAATQEFGKRLARSEFNALAGRRNPDFDTADAFEWLDLGKFVGEDGEPDTKAITAAVERLVPAAENRPPSFDGGSRTPAPAPQSMSGLIRKAAGRA